MAFLKRCIFIMLAINWVLKSTKGDLLKHDSQQNDTNKFKLSLDSKWKFSSGSSDSDATLTKGLPDTPIYKTITGLIGGKVRLPCDVTPPNPADRAELVLLLRGSVSLYSIDARTGHDLNSAFHWKANPDSGIQESWFLKDKSFSGFLLKGIQKAAEGDYFCRVDFESSPTRNLRVRLNVVVPPNSIKILNELQVEVKKSVGPYPEGSTLRLDCVVYGGKPPPDVTWWHSGVMIDGTAEERHGDVTVNTFTFTDITRGNLLTTLTCQGKNSILAPPIKASVSVDMLFPPTTVRIKEMTQSYLCEGVEASYTCESEGSRPAPKITWWKNGFLLNDTTEMVIHEGNAFRSVVTLTPSIDDDQAILTCRAQNPLLSPTSVVEDARRLLVHYAPRLRLNPGQRMNMSRVTEGDDVYLECLIESQPEAKWVKWYHEGKGLQNNKDAGIIHSHASLVLQNVKRNSSGNYTCEASNTVGTTKSNTLLLSVKFVPVCTKSQQFVYGGGNKQLVNVSCQIEAYPDPTDFSWAFNTSAEHVDIPKRLVQSKGSRSVVSYTPLTHLDFGSLLCWSKNEIGEQIVPCVFQVVPASPPETPTNCTVRHEAGTAGEVMVFCKPEWEGGLPQNFTLEVRVKGGSEILAALDGQPTPHFTVTGLTPGTEYLLVVVASNSQGSAPPVNIVHLTPIDIAEKRLSATVVDGNQGQLNLGSGVALVSGIIVALILCFTLLAILVKVRLKQRQRKRTSGLSNTSEQQQLEDLQLQTTPTDKDTSEDKKAEKIRVTASSATQKRFFSLDKFKRKHSGVKKELISKPGTALEIHSPSCSNHAGDTSPLVGAVTSSSIPSPEIQNIPSSLTSPLILPIPTTPLISPNVKSLAIKISCQNEVINRSLSTTGTSSVRSGHSYPITDHIPYPLSMTRPKGVIDNLRGLSRETS